MKRLSGLKNINKWYLVGAAIVLGIIVVAGFLTFAGTTAPTAPQETSSVSGLTSEKCALKSHWKITWTNTSAYKKRVYVWRQDYAISSKKCVAKKVYYVKGFTVSDFFSSKSANYRKSATKYYTATSNTTASYTLRGTGTAGYAKFRPIVLKSVGK